MSSEIHADDIGTQLVVTVYDDGQIVDISGASLLNIILRKPDGTVEIKIADLYTDGLDGKMVYTAEAGDFNMSGNYKIQGKVEIFGGVYYTSVGSFKVHCNL